MTKQILAFLFCFTRELTLYSPPYLLPPRALSLWLNRVKDSTNPILPPYLLPPPTYPPIPHIPPTHPPIRPHLNTLKIPPSKAWCLYLRMQLQPARYACTGGEYRVSSLVKQNKKAKICFVIYIAGFFFKKILL
jgi:hypothetical protein